MTRAHGGISSVGTVGAFLKGRACSDTLLHVLTRAFDCPMKPEERAAMPLAGGIMQHGYQCGMIWGAALAAGAQAHRLCGPGAPAETRAIVAAERLLESFRTQNTHVNCLEITDLDNSSSTMKQITYFLLKGGTIGCLRMSAKYAPVAFAEIEAALSEDPVEVPDSAVSCASVLARRMGATELQTSMAAGLAGGIGLSGGACGALGAAIWIIGLRREKLEFKAPEAMAAIKRFLECTDFEFECEKIVGRKFADVADHADHMCRGGCEKLIEALAAE